MTERTTGIILVADVSTLDELRQLVKTGSASPEVVAIKIGFMLALKYGLESVVRAITGVSKLPVIYDHQKAGTDIPQMGKAFASVCRDSGVHGAIFFPQAGPKVLEEFAKAAIDTGIVPIVGLVMTHPEYLQSEGGYIVDDAPTRIAKTSLKLGVINFVLPGTKPDVIKHFSAGVLSGVNDVSIMMPGIGSQGGSLKNAFNAAIPHRRFAIIGSAIYAAKQPGEALKQFILDL